MPKLTIDGIEVEVEAGSTVIQACEIAGIEIPRFCYHERLAIAGNCRMCLVEIEKMPPKPVASCAMPVAEGMIVHTDTPMVIKARKGVMEFLLINHPLDCPICDQGGECDLQDQAMGYGMDHSRYRENKRAVPNKDFGPLVRTEMTRCIHCTRCVRFSQQIAGIPELGATGRGEDMEITTYLEKAISSELSGNVIDLCPVGALTSKPYAFKARPWELRKTETIDVFDAVGCHIRLDARGNEVLRSMPRISEDVNEEWLSDKSRFAIDGLARQRLDRPYLRENGKLRACTWQEAFALLGTKLGSGRVAAIIGDMADAEAMVALKDLYTGLGSTMIECRQDGAAIDPAHRAGYLFNTTIAGIEDADALLLIGTNPRTEAPVLNARIRKRWLNLGFKVAAIGPQVELTYKADWLGDSPALLDDLLAGKIAFGEILKNASKPMLIIGQGALSRPDGAAILAKARQIADAFGLVKPGWNGFNMLHTAAARVAGLDLGLTVDGGVEAIYTKAGKGELDLVWLLGADEIDASRLGQAFVVYQGHHGDVGAHRADLILPGVAFSEKNATYVNTEGRVQSTKMAVFPPGESKEDWRIIRAVSEAVGHKLPYDNLESVRRRLAEINPALGFYDRVTPGGWGEIGAPGPVSAAPFSSPIENFYMTDPISRVSQTMAQCTAELGKGVDTPRTGTHG